MVTHPDCAYCKIVKEHLKDKIESGEIGIIDTGDEESFKLVVEKLGIQAVPECLEDNGNGGYQRCNLVDLVEK